MRRVFFNTKFFNDPAGGGVLLDSTDVDEDATLGTVVGNLTVAGGGGPYTYTLTFDPDAKFTIVGDELKTDDTLDYDTATSHLITIQADDGVNPVITSDFIITVNEIIVAAGDSLLLFDSGGITILHII